MNSRGGQPLGAAEIVPIVGIAAVDEHVVAGQQRRQNVQRGVDARRRHHEPERARRSQLLHQLLERAGGSGPLSRDRLDLLRVAIESHDLVPRL